MCSKPKKNVSIDRLGNKGFTLVELLAVIVVLSIIALIGYASIGNVVGDVKNKSIAISLRNFEEGLRTNCVSLLASSNVDVNKENIYNKTIDHFDGTIPISSAEDISYDGNSNCDVLIKSPIEVEGISCVRQDSGAWSCGGSDSDSYTTGKPCKVTSGTGNNVGDEITCGTESFYVISSTDTTVKVFAKYNLNVGTNADSTKTSGIQISDGNYPVAFSKTNSVLYSGSIVEEYVNNYLNYLKSTLKMNSSTTATLISKEELITLGCKSNSCSSSYSWISNVRYWTGTYYGSTPTTYVWIVSDNGSITAGMYNVNSLYGVRPVVTILKTDL